jgi:hypothetical protein
MQSAIPPCSAPTPREYKEIKFEFLTAAVKSSVFWNIMLCNDIALKVTQCLGETLFKRKMF